LLDADETVRSKVVAALHSAFEPYVRGDVAQFTAACWTIRARSQHAST
jgi:hypothetical protein